MLPVDKELESYLFSKMIDLKMNYQKMLLVKKHFRKSLVKESTE
jgi:hypothetical protein